MSRFGKFIYSIIALLVIAGASATARADTVTIVGNSTGQFSTATVVCEFNSLTNTFTFTITNTSAITQPGSTATITGIGFDLPPTGNASASGLNGFSGSSSSASFVFSDGDLKNVPQFNAAVLDFGFVTGNAGHFNAGKVENGLAPGESASFTVSGVGFDLDDFTEEEICNAIFVRFQGVNTGEGSDVGVPTNGNGIIPEPSSILLLGTALVGLGGLARRKFKKRSM